MTSARVFAPAMVIALVDWPGDHGTNARIPPIPVPGKPYRSHTGPRQGGVDGPRKSMNVAL